MSRKKTLTSSLGKVLKLSLTINSALSRFAKNQRNARINDSFPRSFVSSILTARITPHVNNNITDRTSKIDSNKFETMIAFDMKLW